MKTTNQPPAFPNAPEPEEIIGLNLITDFTEHFKAVKDCQSVDQFTAAVKPIPVGIRNNIGVAYAKLRSYGYYPSHLDEFDRIVWFYMLDSRPEGIREIANREFTKEECNLARARVHKRMGKANNGGMIKCEPWDYKEGDSGR
jgi:hypothetical protein